jgi:Kef-type K+ transport system membrane component KefB
LFGAIAAATAPAATLDVVQQLGARGKFTETLLGIVAVDDIWGIILFGLVIVFISVNGNGGENVTVLYSLWELFGALILGAALGAVMAMVTGRFRPGQPFMLEALIFVFICAGAAIRLEVSFLLASVAMGTVVANTAKHHSRPFHAIEGIEHPILILFFVLAGASLNLESLMTMGWVGLIYIVFRILGRLAGVHIAGFASGAYNARYANLMSFALLPQAGIPVGLALAVSYKFPKIGGQVLSVVIATTIVFELIGPILARYAIVRSGDQLENR